MIKNGAVGSKTPHTYRTSESWTLKEAVRTRTLWLITIMYAMVAMPIYLITTHGVLHMTDLGYSIMQAAYVLSFVILFGGIARFPMGWLADYVEPRWILIVTYLGMFLSMYGFWQAQNMIYLITAACVFGFSYGASFVVLSTVIGNYYSPAAFASINGFIYPFQVSLGAIVPIMAGYIHDITKSYNIAFICILILIAAATISAIFASAPQKRHSKEILLPEREKVG